MTKLNPNHPVTQSMDEQWYKVAALLMQKFGTNHVVITKEDIDNGLVVKGEMACIVFREREDGLHLQLLPESEARAIAYADGAMPH